MENLQDKLKKIKAKYSYLDIEKMSIEQIENSVDLDNCIKEITDVLFDDFLIFVKNNDFGGKNNGK